MYVFSLLFLIYNLFICLLPFDNKVISCSALFFIIPEVGLDDKKYSYISIVLLGWTLFIYWLCSKIRSWPLPFHRIFLHIPVIEVKNTSFFLNNTLLFVKYYDSFHFKLFMHFCLKFSILKVKPLLTLISLCPFYLSSSLTLDFYLDQHFKNI